MEKSVCKKTICNHSKGWWNDNLDEKATKVKQLKRQFNKRSDPANLRSLNEAVSQFKEEEKNAKESYLNQLCQCWIPKIPKNFGKLLMAVEKVPQNQ